MNAKTVIDAANQDELIDVQYPAGRRGAPAPTAVRRWVRHVLREEERRGGLCVRFVGEAESRQLNSHYRQRDKATNVLSFPARIPLEIAAAPLGDLVICVPVVTQEATAQNKPLGHHYAHMLVHGLLHLLGYDHIQEPDARRMEGREKLLLAQLDIPDPYLVE